MRRMRVCAGAFSTMAMLAGGLVGAPIASTGFEPSEGYTGNDLMFETHSDVGWASEWFHAQGGGPGNPTDLTPWTVATGSGTPAGGLQYYAQHRHEHASNWGGVAAAAVSASTIAMHRLFPEQSGRLYLRMEMRIDTARTGPQWFKNLAGFYIMGNMVAGAAGTGDTPPAGAAIGPFFRFDRNGSLGVNQLGVWSVLPHKWDGTGALPAAVRNWVTIEVDADIPGQMYRLIYEGTDLGTFRFSHEDVESLNGLRLQGPAVSDTDGDTSKPPNPINWQSGSSWDDIYIATSPATGTDCDTSVLPSSDRSALALVGQPASPSNFAFEIYNDSLLSHDYAIQEVLSDGTPTDHTWLSLNKLNVTISGGQSDSFTAVVDPLADDPDLLGGIYTAYIKVTDLTGGCADPLAQTEFLLKVVLTVRDWEVTPSILQSEHYHDDIPGDLPQPIVYTVNNQSPLSLTYAVTESTIQGTAMDYNWVSLDKSGGTVAPSTSDQVSLTIDSGAAVYGRSSAYLKFTQGAFTEIRKISFLKTGPGTIAFVEYLGNIDPTWPNAGGAGISFSTGTTYEQGQIESAAYSSAAAGSGNGEVYRITDSSDMNTKFGAVRDNPEAPLIDIDRLAGATVVARLKVLTPASDPASMGSLFIFDEHIAAAGLYGGTDMYVREVKRGAQNALPIGDGEWHILRMTSFGSVDETRYVRMYLDENPTPVLELTPATGGNTLVSDLGEGLGIPTLGFGAGGVEATMDIAFDWVTGSNAEAFAPGEEVAVLGRSMIPVLCGDPYADFDKDGDVDSVDFAGLQRCITIGAVAPSIDAACRCVDRDRDDDVDESDVQSFIRCATGPMLPLDLGCDDWHPPA